MEKRLDVLVCDKLNVSREYAKEIILGGKCRVNGKVIGRPGVKFSEDAVLQIDAEKLPYVSRGGLKLAKALGKFEIDLTGQLCIDIGASTGGFTDCMVQHGADKVIAIDNGHDQLAKALGQNPQIISMEGRDIREVASSDLPFQPDFAAVDLSFISLEKVIPTVSNLLKPNGQGVFLVKPQFECGAKELNKKGVVTKAAAHLGAIRHVCACLSDNGFVVENMDFSPVTGQNGNIEYLILASKTAYIRPVPKPIEQQDFAENLVAAAFAHFGGK